MARNELMIGAAILGGGAMVGGLMWWLRRWRHRPLELGLIATELRAKGYCVIDGLVGRAFASRMAADVRRLRVSGDMRPGRLQHGVAVDSNVSTRGDLIRLFASGDDHLAAGAGDALAGYFQLMDDVREALDADAGVSRTVRGRMGLSKFMAACYPGDGARYVRHRDAWPHKPGRKLTLILYLNEGWRPGHGGCLRIWPEAPEGGAQQQQLAPVSIEPRMDRLVVFCSWLEHEVEPAHAERYALTTWFYSEKDALLELIADQLRRNKSRTAALDAQLT
jgi:SM-20-related protein